MIDFLKFFKQFFFKKPEDTSLRGSQRSLANISTSYRRNWDLEIPEVAIRDPQLARPLIEMRTWCYEARHFLLMAGDDTFASDDGDDQGFGIADTLDDEVTPVNPEVYAIATDVITRNASHEQKVIGGDRLKKALILALAYGDCFIEIGIEKEGIGRKDYGVSKTLYLPTWEMFRKESDQGILEGFEQRKYISSYDPDYFFYPPQIVHIRHDQQFLYGQSIFFQSLTAWAKLKEAAEFLHSAARDLGVNPNLHILPPDVTPQQKQQYIESYETKKIDGFVYDLYLYPDQDIRKLANVNPQLQPLIDNFLQWRYRVIPPGVPVWFYPGLITTGAREISQEPAKKYARMRYSWCSMLTKAVKQVIDTEIILKKGWDWYRENGNYRVVWPKWNTGTDSTGTGTGSEADNMTDDESEAKEMNELEFYKNGNGRQFTYN